MRAIAINNSWRLAPWADVLYACDGQWWIEHNGVPTFNGLKVSLDIPNESGADVRNTIGARERYPDIHFCPSKRSEFVQFDRVGTIGWGGNSGFQALNLCLYLGVARIVLVGFDMSDAAGKHWHGAHGWPLYNPSRSDLERYRGSIDGASEAFASRGIDVVNASAASALTAYRKVDFCEYLGIEECAP